MAMPLLLALPGVPAVMFLAYETGARRYLGLPFAMIMFAVLLVALKRWQRRHVVMAFDTSGFWWITPEGTVRLAWDTLAGVGFYEFGKVVTLELCPQEPLDRDDPLLWKFVRDTDPLREGMPRLRYRIDLSSNVKPCEEAARLWAPHLWFGRVYQRPGTQGTPDHKGHQERLRAVRA